MGKTINTIKENSFFVTQAPAYTISNENQRWATGAIPGIKSVLTVAGSGDQALFYKLNGIKIIDTFDITRNACVIQDIKYTAIKNLNLDEYKDLLIKLYHGHDYKGILSDLWKFLPSRTRKEIDKGWVLLCRGLDANTYPENIPTETEFAKLKDVLNKPFRFIWSDLELLQTKISRKYDLINISNIFDYWNNWQKQIYVLHYLSQCLNIDGRIVYLPQAPKFRYENVQLPNLVYEKMEKYKNTTMMLFQRTK